MSLSVDIRDAAAELALIVAHELGAALAFIQAGTKEKDAVTVYGVFAEGQSVRTGAEAFTVYVPRQTGFPPAAGDLHEAKIRYPVSTGTLYEVRAVRMSPGDPDGCAVFELECGRYGGSPETGEDRET
jgi:hypothetical protein